MKNGRIFAIVFGLLMLLFAAMNYGESDNPIQAVKQYRSAREHEIINEFVRLLSIPNVSSDRANVRKNAEFIQKMMAERGIDTRIMETAGNPVIYGKLDVDPSAKTLMFYVHYDGQPVDPSKWTETQPFKPALRPGKLKAGTTEPKPISFPGSGEKVNEDWRIYARSASDDKAPIIAILTALDALKATGIQLKHNLKFVFEGEEEAGSINLQPFLEKHRDLFKADVLFMCDGPAYYSGDPTLFFGVRGITTIEITVYGPNTSVHSGHYGNWAPNPAVRLAHLLVSMRDTTGRVKIKGFYDTTVPLTETEMEALRAVPAFEDEIKENYGFSGQETNWDSLLQSIQFPALNVNGLHSGWVGAQQRTIVPPKATVAIDIRLAKGNDPKDLVQKIITHIKEQGYHVIDRDPDHKTRMSNPLIAKVIANEDGYRAHRTPMDLPISQSVMRSLKRLSDRRPVFLPSLGGSLPIHMFYATLQIPIIGVSIVNHDNNQHQQDENIRIGHLWQGIETYAAILMMDEE